MAKSPYAICRARILELVPGWKRGDCWRRIRQLRRTPALAIPSAEQDSKKADGNGSLHRPFSRPWSQEDDDKLLDLAGYEPVTKIAERLGRSVRAVRFRLGALGMSARVKDGWSQRGLRKLLRVSRARLRYLVASGMLRVRDPRITGGSLAYLCDNKNPGEGNNHRTKAAIVEQNAYSWKRAAKLLGVTVEDTQKLIAEGQLKLLDTFVTDRSFEDFCRKHGSEINLSLMDPATKRWLMSEYGISEAADGKAGAAGTEARANRSRVQMWTEDSGQRLFQACKTLSAPKSAEYGRDHVTASASTFRACQ